MSHPKEIGRLRDKLAEAIRDCGSHYDETPWEQLSDERKIGWIGDADRALAAIKAEGFSLVKNTRPARKWSGKKSGWLAG